MNNIFYKLGKALASLSYGFSIALIGLTSYYIYDIKPLLVATLVGLFFSGIIYYDTYAKKKVYK